MLVRDLIKRLSDCNPEATVTIERDEAFSRERITGMFDATIKEVVKSDMEGRCWTKKLNIIVLTSEWIHVPV